MPHDAKPLPRLGYYVIKEASWTNPLPERGLQGDRLATFWTGLLKHHADASAARDRPAEPGHEYDHGRIVWRYGLKIEIKTCEAVAALVHAVVAPTAPFLCDHACPHIALGMTAEQLKRVLDTFDAYVAGNTRGVPEDLEEENYVVWSARRELAALARGLPEGLSMRGSAVPPNTGA